MEILAKAPAVGWSVRIRNFDRTESHSDIDSLRVALKTRYLGRSVTLQINTPRRSLDVLAFIDVTDNGDLVESYGSQQDFDLVKFIESARVDPVQRCDEPGG